MRFYTNQQQLVYQEIMDRPLYIARRQTKLKLNRALEQTVYVRNATRKILTDRQWVAIQFDKN